MPYEPEEENENSVQLESEEVQQAEYYGVTRRVRAAAGERREPLSLWLISYSDFITILFVFFMAMYGYAVTERDRQIASVGAPISHEDFSKLMNRLQEKVGIDLQIKEDVNKITLQVGERILFASGKAQLNEAADRTLAELADSLKLVEGDIVVEGHTDNVPVRGVYKSNWELSAARSFAVIQTLTHRGVPRERLSAWGFGEYRPLTSNDSEVGRRRNRRIEIILFKKTSNKGKVS